MHMIKKKNDLNFKILITYGDDKTSDYFLLFNKKIYN